MTSLSSSPPPPPPPDAPDPWSASFPRRKRRRPPFAVCAALSLVWGGRGASASAEAFPAFLAAAGGRPSQLRPVSVLPDNLAAPAAGMHTATAAPKNSAADITLTPPKYISSVAGPNPNRRGRWGLLAAAGAGPEGGEDDALAPAAGSSSAAKTAGRPDAAPARAEKKMTKVRRPTRESSPATAAAATAAAATAGSLPGPGQGPDQGPGSGGVSRSRRRRGGEAQRRSQSRRQAPAEGRGRRNSKDYQARGAWYQRAEMMQHRLLTREEDLELGRQIQEATAVRTALANLASDRRYERDQRERIQRGGGDFMAGPTGSEDAGGVEMLTDEELLSLGMSVNGIGIGSGIGIGNGGSGGSSSSEGGLSSLSLSPSGTDEDDDETSSLFSGYSGFSIFSEEDQYQDALSGMPTISKEAMAVAAVSAARPSANSVAVKEGGRFSPISTERDVAALTDEDVTQVLEIRGGKKEIRAILSQGAEARSVLMRSNIRLVVSIAKKWMRGSAGGGGASSSGPSLQLMRDLYAGGWDRPSLDELVQEGVVGLARAVDKYDYSKGLRFSTYSTYWITNYVRLSLLTAKTGSLRVPHQLHEIKARYKKLMSELYQEDKPIPPPEEIASILGVTRKRLEMSLTVTESLVSIDDPVSTSIMKRKGSGAGDAADSKITLADMLQCHEPQPEDHVELSFLRQCLENAMAAELSPYERDVVRLRLGLDDGKSRSVREVAEVCGGAAQAADVRRAERRALKKLSSPNAIFAYNLKDYLHMVGLGQTERDSTEYNRYNGR